MVSAKSILELGTEILFLGKVINTQSRLIWSHPRAVSQMLAQRIRLAMAAKPHEHFFFCQQFWAFINWHLRPKAGMGPFLAGCIVG